MDARCIRIKKFGDTKISGYVWTGPQRHLSEDCHNLSSWFRDNELVLNLKKGKTECMIFGIAKRLNALNGRQLALTVNGTLINTCLLYTSPSPRDGLLSRMPSSA